MDRLLYVAMTGASQNAKSQAIQANNLANVKTTGFRADFAQARSMQVFGDSMPSRVYSMVERPGSDLSPGMIEQTGGETDVAIEGPGFITVMGQDGKEAYTRNGNLFVDDLGNLKTSTGMSVMGDGGLITLPPYQKIDISTDGTVSIIGQGQGAETLTQVDRIKLVNPAKDEVSTSEDGLFRRPDGLIEAPAPEVKLAPGFLETSNVNAVAAMTEILSLSRQFELQVKMMKTAEENDETAARLMQIS
jgi:flagellar basal-body rod protein FlgF